MTKEAVAVEQEIEQSNEQILQDTIGKLNAEVNKLGTANANLETALRLQQITNQKLEATVAALTEQRDLFMSRDLEARTNIGELKSSIDAQNQRTQAVVRTLQEASASSEKRMLNMNNDLNDVRQKFGDVRQKLGVAEKQLTALRADASMFDQALTWYVGVQDRLRASIGKKLYAEGITLSPTLLVDAYTLADEEDLVVSTSDELVALITRADVRSK